MFALAGWKIYKKRVGQKQTEPIWKQRGIGCGRLRVGAWVCIERNCPEPTLSKAHRPHIPILTLTLTQTLTSIPPPCNCRHPRFCQASHSRVFFGEADFFSAKRLFFRAARDVSGVRSSPPWARVEIKLKMSFQALSHSPSHERALALTSPPPDFLFSSIHQNPTIPPQIKQHSLLVLPSVHTIINFATKFFEMFTKKQS